MKEKEVLVGWDQDGWRCVLTRWFSDFQGRWLVDCCVFDEHDNERWHHGYSRVAFTTECAEAIVAEQHARIAGASRPWR